MKINKEWHEKNKLTRGAGGEERVRWHVDHWRECGCRAIPPKVLEMMKRRKPKLVVGVLARRGSKYLLVREKLEGGKEWWIVPGGKVEFGESLEEAACRELVEEVGIAAKKLKFMTHKEAIFADYNYHTVIFFYETKTRQEKLGEDVEGKVLEARWVTRAEIGKLPLIDSAKWLFEEFLGK